MDGERADGRVEEVSGRQGGVTGLTEELGGLGSLSDSGGLACRVGAATVSGLGLTLTQNNKLIKIVDK